MYIFVKLCKLASLKVKRASWSAVSDNDDVFYIAGSRARVHWVGLPEACLAMILLYVIYDL